jgi:putative SOS response-associated peptidase YedK
MCGRATLTVSVEEIAEVLGTAPVDIGPPKYNLAPTQPMLIVRERRNHAREMVFVRWGLVPHWAKPDEAKRIGSRCVQARIESAARSPAFREAFRSRRCLVIVDGFYEWKTLESGERRPHHVRRDDRKPFAIAGLWASWRSPDGGPPLESCAVVTTEAAGPIRALHDRMPLVVAPNVYDAWLAGPAGEAGAAAGIVAAAADLVTVPVSTWVNDVRHDDPRCLEPE